MATVNLTPGTRRAKYEPVTIGEQSFEVEMTPPSFADRLQDSELVGSEDNGAWLSHRLKSTVTGWRGLRRETETQPANAPGPRDVEDIPFSWETLAALCEQYPEVYPQVVSLAHAAYRTLTPDEVKN
jgi:hypothetical protein